MKEIEKLKVGFEYCYEDAEIDVIRQNAIKNCRIYNSIDDDDKQKQYDFLCEMLGSIGENVCLAKTFSVIMEKTYSLEIILQETLT